MSKIIENINITKEFETFLIDSNDDYELNIEGNNSGSLFIRISKGNNITVNSNINGDNSVNIIFWNEADNKICFEENYVVNDDGELNVSYGECNSGDTDRNTLITLKGKEANAVLNSASLVNSKKNYHIRLVNDNLKTKAQINNHAVVLSNGRLMIDAIGKINKGAKKAESHQISRALAFSEGQNTTILPELLIDENDVAASHAMSIGRVDENHLYYMMSRGLDINECTRLISLGYLLPITDNIQDDKLRETLKEELERKINELCLN